MIEEGRVTVNGVIATLGDQADPESDEIRLDGEPIRTARREHTYVMLHKPRGVISTVSDPHGRRTVRDLVPLRGRLYPVGRLDADSEGLVLLTDDGALTHRLTHPRYEHPRVYRVLVKGEVTEGELDRWRKGITIEGKRVRFDEAQVESRDRDRTWLRVTLHEGSKHIVRRVVAALGHPAVRLIRVEMGPLKLGELPSGKWRKLSAGEVKRLQKLLPSETRSARRAAKKRRGGPSRRRKRR
jgi:pseudouridine synthase